MSATLLLPEVWLDQLADLVAAKLADRLPAAPEPWPEFMSEETAARYLDTTVGRMQKLRSRGQIPSLQDEKRCRVFYERAALDAWMRAKQTPANLAPITTRAPVSAPDTGLRDYAADALQKKS